MKIVKISENLLCVEKYLKIRLKARREQAKNNLVG